MGSVDLDLSADVVTLTEQLVDIESVSGDERQIADAVEAALATLPHLTVTRRGHTVVARTELDPTMGAPLGYVSSARRAAEGIRTQRTRS